MKVVKFMQILYGVQHLNEYFVAFNFCHRFLAIQIVKEIAVLCEVHHHVHFVVLLEDRPQLHNMRMVQLKMH